MLIHCKMGISRSATVTISYVMKEYAMTLEESLKMVRGRRGIVKPNKSFLKQLEVYEGILGAIRHRLGLFRSKSESSLVPSPIDTSANEKEVEHSKPEEREDDEVDLRSSRSPPVRIRVDIKALATFFTRPSSEPAVSYRPKSWSPNEQLSRFLLDEVDQAEEDGRSLFGKKGEDEDDEDCNCFGELSNLDDAAQRLLAVETRNPGMSAATTRHHPVNSSLFNPDCDCDMELELDVPEAPVSVVADPEPDPDAAAVVIGISSVPLRVRSSLPDVVAQMRQRHPPPPNPPPPPPPPPPDKQVEEDEELSVRTLAGMFDYSRVSVPTYKACSARLEENRLFQRAKKLTGEISRGEESNC